MPREAEEVRVRLLNQVDERWQPRSKASELRRLAGGMPHRLESNNRELIDWLVKQRLHSIDNL